MPNLTSRRRLAEYTADRLIANDDKIIGELAALILSENREREIDLIVRDVEDGLAKRGVLVATVETATKLADKIRGEIVKMLDSPDVRLREVVNPELIGGVKISTPSAILDDTVAKKIHSLKSRKI